MFKSYRIPKFSKHPNYLPGGKYYDFISVTIHGKYCRELCANCGYALGSHYSNECPIAEQIQRQNDGYKTEFYPELLNVNIRVL